MDKLFSDMRTYADKLEIRNGGHFNPREDGGCQYLFRPVRMRLMLHIVSIDSPPDTIDDLLWSLEEACTSASPSESPQAIIARTTREEAGWLARAIREKISKDRENMGDEIEKELQVCSRLSSAVPPLTTGPYRLCAHHAKCATFASWLSKTASRESVQSSSPRRLQFGTSCQRT